MSTHIQPILEQQHLIAGDNALSAIQSNESFEIDRKEARVASKFKNYLSNNKGGTSQLERSEDKGS